MAHIYGIINLITNNIYVGKTRNYKKRFIKHKSLLKNNKHFNKYLQNSYNKHGLINFKFILLEQCLESEITDMEQKWVDYYSNCLFNHVKDVKKLSGPTNPFYGHKHSKSTKEKLSLAAKGKYIGSNNPNYGRVRSSEELRLMTINRGKLRVEEVMEICELLKIDNLSHKEIANIFSISRTVITRISNGKRWSNVTGIKKVDKHRKGSKLSDSHKIRIGNSHRGMKHKKGGLK